jgi:hypothetical protein
MISSRNEGLILTLYKSNNMVFTLPGVALLTGETNFKLLNQRLNYHVHTGKLLRPRRGIYAKPGFQIEELACILYTPSYISMEYVLQRTGIVFQYDNRITAVSYLSRSIVVDNKTIAYRKIKNEILISSIGINREGNCNIASPERALLDTLYLNGEVYFDSTRTLNTNLIYQILPIYASNILNERINKLFQNDGHKQA